jgi:hypothetical protein
MLCNRRKAAAILLILLKRKKEKRKYWIRPAISRRHSKGEFTMLVKEIEKEDDAWFYKYMRMNRTNYQLLVDLVKKDICKKSTNMRMPISPEERVALTLRYLAHGDSMQFIAITYRIGHSTVCGIINSTTRAIWKTLSPTYLPPSNLINFSKIEERFRTLWNFPNCIGAIDGKHVAIQCPSNSGSDYYNYKGGYSIVLMAACDAEYNFTFIDIGAYGKQNDAKTFSDSCFGKQIINNPLRFPTFELTFCGQQHRLSGVFVADDAFPLRNNIMKPYAGHMLLDKKAVFNYRLSRARRVIENTFGIMATKWRIFRKPIIMEPENVDFVIKACCALHNFILKCESASPMSLRRYLNSDCFDTTNNGLNASVLRPIGVARHGNISNEAHLVRDTFSEYFMSEEGRVPWQLNSVGRGDALF